MEHVNERLREPFGGLDEAVFGPTPVDAIGWELKRIFAEVMTDWADGIPSAPAVGEPALAQCERVLRRHRHTDPATGETREDYITRELHKEGMTA